MILFLLTLPAIADAQQGVYTDAAGARHRWKIDRAHTLIWNGKPFLPLGTWFVSHYLDTGKEEQWAQDVAALEQLVSKGITDFYIGWAGRPPEQYQRLIDWFEAHGCTYGIIPARYDWDPLHGYKMTAHKLDIPRADAVRVSSDSERLKLAGAAFVAVDDAGKILAAGTRQADAAGGGVSLEDERLGGRGSLWYIRRIEVADANGFDWWSGSDRHKANVIAFLKALKTGPGLRLIIDPFFNEEGFYWGTENVIPDSPAYRAAFRGWLGERHRSVASLNEAWAVMGDTVETFEQAARLIPIVVGQRHGSVGYLLDPSTQSVFRVDLRKSVVLLDLLEGRDTLYARLHNDIAGAIRARAVDVPVVYKRVGWLWRGFINLSNQGGFDGLGLEVYKAGEGYGVPAATYLSELRQSKRPMWYVTTETNHAPEGERPAGLVGYPSREVMWAELDRQMALGVKGIYLFAAQPQNGRKIFEPQYDLLAVPEQYDWFAAYKRRVSSESSVRVPHRARVWFSYPANSPDLAGSGDLTSVNLPTDAWRAPDRNRTWVLPSYRADVETDVLFTCLDSTPLNRRYGAQLADVIRRKKTRVVYAGLRPDRQLIPGLDQYFTGATVVEDGVRYQVLRGRGEHEVLATLKTGEIWALRTGRLTIVAKDGALREWAGSEGKPADAKGRSEADGLLNRLLAH